MKYIPLILTSNKYYMNYYAIKMEKYMPRPELREVVQNMFLLTFSTPQEIT